MALQRIPNQYKDTFRSIRISILFNIICSKSFCLFLATSSIVGHLCYLTLLKILLRCQCGVVLGCKVHKDKPDCADDRHMNIYGKWIFP